MQICSPLQPEALVRTQSPTLRLELSQQPDLACWMDQQQIRHARGVVMVGTTGKTSVEAVETLHVALGAEDVDAVPAVQRGHGQHVVLKDTLRDRQWRHVRPSW